MKVLLHGHFNTFTGYGLDAIGLAKTLLLFGVDLYLYPESVKPPVHPAIAALLTKEPQDSYDLVIAHVDPSYLRPVAKAEVSVGWSMWEHTTLDPLPQVRERFADKTQGFDLLFAYDSVSAQAFAEAGVRCPVEVLQGGYWSAEWGFVQRDWFAKPFRFFMLGQLHTRKDPFVAIEAYRELRAEYPEVMADTELTLKTQAEEIPQAMESWTPGLRIGNGVWPRAAVKDFYSTQHMLLAPSRGEGKNLPALEFMATGGVVAATNWGGHTQWLSSQYAYPIDYHLEPTNVFDVPKRCQDARASKESLKQIMLDAVQHRDEAARKGELASRVIPQMCGWVPVVEKFLLRLPDSVPKAADLCAAMQYRVIDREQPLPRYLLEVG